MHAVMIRGIEQIWWLINKLAVNTKRFTIFRFLIGQKCKTYGKGAAVIIKLNYTTHMLRVKSHRLYHSHDPDQATFESAMAAINCGVQVTIDH